MNVKAPGGSEGEVDNLTEITRMEGEENEDPG